MEIREITQCRACGSRGLVEVLDLGLHCVSDFVENGQQPDRAPLVLVRCENCTLVQLQHTVPRERLYSRYWYRSGTNESMVAALQDVVDHVYRLVKPRTTDVWLDIGANDGTLLSLIPRYDFIRAAFEPSYLAVECRQHADVVYQEFFPPKRMGPKWARVITSIAMFYDLDDPNEFVAAIKQWLHPKGVWVIQMGDLGGMLDCNGFDNICHEHLCYYDAHSLGRLLHRHGLYIDHLTFNKVNGYSLRAVVRHGARQPAYAARDGVLAFCEQVERLRARTVALLADLKAQGKLVLGYGASTKGNTLLQYYGITPDLLPAIADRNPEKWGRKTVGTGIPIISEENARVMDPDYFLVLPWHFMDSFRVRERAFLERGGRFIVPLPTLRLEGIDVPMFSAKSA